MIKQIAITTVIAAVASVALNRKLIEDNDRKAEAINKLADFSEYLANKLDDNDVELDEFDEIAIELIVS